MWQRVEAFERQKRDSWHNTNFKDVPVRFLWKAHKEGKTWFRPATKTTHTYLFNILIQLLIWINLPHQVLQLLFAENLTRKQMYLFFFFFILFASGLYSVWSQNLWLTGTEHFKVSQSCDMLCICLLNMYTITIINPTMLHLESHEMMVCRRHPNLIPQC